MSMHFKFNKIYVACVKFKVLSEFIEKNWHDLSNDSNDSNDTKNKRKKNKLKMNEEIDWYIDISFISRMYLIMNNNYTDLLNSLAN